MGCLMRSRLDYHVRSKTSCHSMQRYFYRRSMHGSVYYRLSSIRRFYVSDHRVSRESR